jgi:hypothetical protein
MKLWQVLLQALVVIAVPVVLIVMPIRALMHPRWVLFEYARPDFPADLFGFAGGLTWRSPASSPSSGRGASSCCARRLADSSPAFVERGVTTAGRARGDRQHLPGPGVLSSQR